MGIKMCMVSASPPPALPLPTTLLNVVQGPILLHFWATGMIDAVA